MVEITKQPKAASCVLGTTNSGGGGVAPEVGNQKLPNFKGVKTLDRKMKGQHGSFLSIL